MKKKFSPHWRASKQPRKQRKYRINAPLHIRHKLMSSHMSKELRQKYKRRGFPIRKGDKVKVMRGQFRGVIGEIESVDMKNMKVLVKGAEFKAKAGAAPRKYPLDASKLMIITLNTDDKTRVRALERNIKMPGKIKQSEHSSLALQVKAK